MTIDIDLHPTRTIPELAQYLRDVSTPEDIEKLVSELATTPRQSGMESNHEKWIMATLNFLNGMDIPFYRRDARGNKLSGANGEIAIPERLSMLREKFAEERRVAAKRYEELAARNDALARESENDARKIEELTKLVAFYQDFATVIATEVKRLETLRAPPAETPPSEARPPDPSGS